MATGCITPSSPESYSTPNISKLLTNLRKKLVITDDIYLWMGDINQIKQFVDLNLNLIGKWTSPGGDTKLFTSECGSVCLKWLGRRKRKLIVVKDTSNKFANSLEERNYSFELKCDEDNVSVGSEMSDDFDNSEDEMELESVLHASLITYRQDGTVTSEGDYIPSEQLVEMDKDNYEIEKKVWQLEQIYANVLKYSKTKS